jgi:hypothetical protein
VIAVSDTVLTPERFAEELYNLPYEDSADLRDFTVTVAGPERWNGEAPYTYVVRGPYKTLAWSEALAWHLLNEEVLDAYVVASLSHDGPPPPDAGYVWNDLRPQQEEFVTRSQLLGQARHLSEEFTAAAARYRGGDGEVNPRDYARFDELRATYGEEALELVHALAALGSDTAPVRHQQPVGRGSDRPRALRRRMRRAVRRRVRRGHRRGVRLVRHRPRRGPR